MEIASFARKTCAKCPPLAYACIPISKAVDRAKKFGLHDRLEKNIRIYCSPQQQEDKTYMRRLRRDIWYCVVRYNCSPAEYFMYGFDRLNHAARKEYVCSWEAVAARSKITAANPKWEVFAGKYNTYLSFKKYYKRDMILVDQNLPDEELLSFIAAHPRFIVKPYFDGGGKGVYFIETSTPPRRTFWQNCINAPWFWRLPSFRVKSWLNFIPAL